jgi:hypothetical protein
MPGKTRSRKAIRRPFRTTLVAAVTAKRGTATIPARERAKVIQRFRV